MALNWAKAAQVGGRSIRESGMLMGGLMLDIEKLRENRLAAKTALTEERAFQTASAGLTQAQKAYKAVFDNDFSIYKSIQGELDKAPVGGDLAAGAEGLAEWRTATEARRDEAWATAENSKADFLRASHIEYKKQPDPPDPTGTGLIQGLDLQSIVDAGMVNFKDKAKLIGKYQKKLEAGDVLNLDKSMRDAQEAIFNWHEAKSIASGRLRLTDPDKEALTFTRDEAAKVRKGIREALREWEAEVAAPAPEVTGVTSQEGHARGGLSPATGLLTAFDLLKKGAEALPRIEHGIKMPAGPNQRTERKTEDIEADAVKRYESQLSQQAQQFWQKYLETQVAKGTIEALSLLGEEFQSLSQADKKIIARLQPDFSK